MSVLFKIDTGEGDLTVGGGSPNGILGCNRDTRGSTILGRSSHRGNPHKYCMYENERSVVVLLFFRFTRLLGPQFRATVTCVCVRAVRRGIELRNDMVCTGSLWYGYMLR